MLQATTGGGDNDLINSRCRDILERHQNLPKFFCSSHKGRCSEDSQRQTSGNTTNQEYNNDKKADSQEQISGHQWGGRGINY